MNPSLSSKISRCRPARRVNLGILACQLCISRLRVYIEIIIRHGDMVIRVVDMVLWSHWWRIGFGWGSGFLIQKSEVFEDLLYYLLVLYHTDYFHFSRTFWTGKGIKFIIIYMKRRKLALSPYIIFHAKILA